MLFTFTQSPRNNQAKLTTSEFQLLSPTHQKKARGIKEPGQLPRAPNRTVLFMVENNNNSWKNKTYGCLKVSM